MNRHDEHSELKQLREQERMMWQTILNFRQRVAERDTELYKLKHEIRLRDISLKFLNEALVKQEAELCVLKRGIKSNNDVIGKIQARVEAYNAWISGGCSGPNPLEGLPVGPTYGDVLAVTTAKEGSNWEA
jgi:hypothetical protein